MVIYSNSGKDFKIPDDIIKKWQRMVNIMSKLLRVPTGFIMKVNAPVIQIFTTNVADTNLYQARQNYPRPQTGFAMQKSKDEKEVE
jgi:hypothetical protein